MRRGDTKPPPHLSPVDSGGGGRMWSASNRKRRRQSARANPTPKLPRSTPPKDDIVPQEELYQAERVHWQEFNSSTCRMNLAGDSDDDNNDSTGRLAARMRSSRPRSSPHRLVCRSMGRTRSQRNASTTIFAAVLLAAAAVVALTITTTRASANQTPTSSLQSSGKFLHKHLCCVRLSNNNELVVGH